MAKINHILFGQGKGKVGGLVLQRYEGMNVVREKPISVKNPQSTKQTLQRAKFKLASQTLAELKEVIMVRLSGVSIYNRIKRSAAINAIIPYVDASAPETPFIALDSLLSAINEKSVSPLAGPAVTISGNNFSIVAADGDTCVYAITNYDEQGHLVSKKAETYTSDGTAKQVPYDANDYSSVLVAVSYHANTEAGRAIIGNTNNTNGTEFAIAISRGITTGDIEVSNMTGSSRSEA